MTQLKLVGNEEAQGDLLQGVVADPVLEVFEFWKALLDKPHAMCGPKRRQRIKAMLTLGYTVEQLKLAVVGCKYDSFAQGENDRDRKFDDIELICRDETKVDFFIEIGDTYMKKAQRKAQAQATTTETPAVPMPDFVREKLRALFEQHRRK